MTREEAIALLKKSLNSISKALDEFYEEIPSYLRREMLHPKKKPRGSMRRMRRRRKGKE